MSNTTNIEYKDKYDENEVIKIPKQTNKYEFQIGQRVKYLGALYNKGSYCTITKIVNNSSKIYYSVRFDHLDKEVNYILASVLRKIEVDNESEVDSDENN